MLHRTLRHHSWPPHTYVRDVTQASLLDEPSDFELSVSRNHLDVEEIDEDYFNDETISEP